MCAHLSPIIIIRSFSFLILLFLPYPPTREKTMKWDEEKSGREWERELRDQPTARQTFMEREMRWRKAWEMRETYEHNNEMRGEKRRCREIEEITNGSLSSSFWYSRTIINSEMVRQGVGRERDRLINLSPRVRRLREKRDWEDDDHQHPCLSFFLLIQDLTVLCCESDRIFLPPLFLHFITFLGAVVAFLFNLSERFLPLSPFVSVRVESAAPKAVVVSFTLSSLPAFFRLHFCFFIFFLCFLERGCMYLPLTCRVCMIACHLASVVVCVWVVFPLFSKLHSLHSLLPLLRFLMLFHFGWERNTHTSLPLLSSCVKFTCLFLAKWG